MYYFCVEVYTVFIASLELSLLPYFRVIRHILLKSAYSLISAYCFVGLNTH